MPPSSESSRRGIESYFSAFENPRRVGINADWYYYIIMTHYKCSVETEGFDADQRDREQDLLKSGPQRDSFGKAGVLATAPLNT